MQFADIRGNGAMNTVGRGNVNARRQSKVELRKDIAETLEILLEKHNIGYFDLVRIKNFGIYWFIADYKKQKEVNI